MSCGDYLLCYDFNHVHKYCQSLKDNRSDFIHKIFLFVNPIYKKGKVQNKMKFKSYVLMFMASILVFTSSLSATTIKDDTYKKTISNYIEELSILQNQIFALAHKATFSSSSSSSSFNTELDAIYNNLNKIYESMTVYYNALSPRSIERRNLLVLFNAVNLLRGSLFQLDKLNDTQSSLEKMTILENYFGFKLEANNTINNVRSLLSQL